MAFPTSSLLYTIVRYMAALLMLLGGISGWLFILGYAPFKATPGATHIAEAMMAESYLYHLLKALELLIGGMLLFRRLVLLAIVMLVPITVNIVVLHLTDPQGLPVALLLLALNSALVYWHWGRLKLLLG
jgi:hypothetical protein